MPAIAGFYITAVEMMKNGAVLGKVQPPMPKKLSIRGCNLEVDLSYQEQWGQVPKENKMKRRHFVVKTLNDGNCLLNAICLGCYGTQDQNVVENLRWLMVRDMILHGMEYLQRENVVSIGNKEAGNFIQETMRLLRTGSELTSWHIFAAANVLHVNIEEYHPQLPNIHMFPHPAREPRRFHFPASGQAPNTISILDCGVITPYPGLISSDRETGMKEPWLKSKGTFEMNHYSCLLPEHGTPGRQSHECY